MRNVVHATVRQAPNRVGTVFGTRSVVFFVCSMPGMQHDTMVPVLPASAHIPRGTSQSRYRGVLPKQTQRVRRAHNLHVRHRSSARVVRPAAPCPSPPPSAIFAAGRCPIVCARWLRRVGPGTDDEASKGSLISVLRAFRLVRLFKLAQYPAARTLWTRKGAC
jgi:hypothetical protein